MVGATAEWDRWETSFCGARQGQPDRKGAGQVLPELSQTQGEKMKSEWYRHEGYDILYTNQEQDENN